jgi:hypothetical protein
MPNKTLVYGIGGKSYIWMRCEETWVLMVQDLNHLRYEWTAVGEVVLRQIYDGIPAAWAAVIFTNSGKHVLGSSATKEEAWGQVEQSYDLTMKKIYSSVTTQSPSEGASSTS